MTLVALPGERARLAIKDDGPGQASARNSSTAGQNLGMRIVQGLAEQTGDEIELALIDKELFFPFERGCTAH